MRQVDVNEPAPALGALLRASAAPKTSEPKRIAPGVMQAPDGKLFTDAPLPMGPLARKANSVRCNTCEFDPQDGICRSCRSTLIDQMRARLIREVINTHYPTVATPMSGARIMAQRRAERDAFSMFGHLVC